MHAGRQVCWLRIVHIVSVEALLNARWVQITFSLGDLRPFRGDRRENRLFSLTETFDLEDFE